MYVLRRWPVRFRGIHEAVPSQICSKNVLLNPLDVGKMSVADWANIASYASSNWMMFIMRVHLVCNKFVSAMSGEAANSSVRVNYATYPLFAIISHWRVTEIGKILIGEQMVADKR